VDWRGWPSIISGGEFDDGDNGAVNFIFHRAIRQNPQLVALAAGIGNLFLNDAEIGHHLQDDGLEVWDFDNGIDVQQGPPNVGGNQAKEFLRLSGKAADGQVAADHNHGDFDAIEQIGEVGVDLSNLEMRNTPDGPIMRPNDFCAERGSRPKWTKP